MHGQNIKNQTEKQTPRKINMVLNAAGSVRFDLIKKS